MRPTPAKNPAGGSAACVLTHFGRQHERGCSLERPGGSSIAPGRASQLDRPTPTCHLNESDIEPRARGRFPHLGTSERARKLEVLNLG